MNLPARGRRGLYGTRNSARNGGGRRRQRRDAAGMKGVCSLFIHDAETRPESVRKGLTQAVAETTIHPPPLPVRRQARFGAWRVVVALMLREMATSHGRSPGGYLWAVLEPVAGVALLSAIFSVALHQPGLGVCFPLFYATGMLPFTMFGHLTAKLAQSMEFSRPLLAFPGVTWRDALAARFLLNTATQLMVSYVVFAGILLIYRTRAVLDFGALIEAYALCALLGLGFGTLNCLLQGLFPIWMHLWSILMRPMFIISTIFFLMETIPPPFRDWLWWNPLVHVIAILRRGIYPTYDASWAAPGYVALLGLGTLALGLLFLRRHHRAILLR